MADSELSNKSLRELEIALHMSHVQDVHQLHLSFDTWYTTERKIQYNYNELTSAITSSTAIPVENQLLLFKGRQLSTLTTTLVNCCVYLFDKGVAKLPTLPLVLPDTAFQPDYTLESIPVLVKQCIELARDVHCFTQEITNHQQHLSDGEWCLGLHVDEELDLVKRSLKDKLLVIRDFSKRIDNLCFLLENASIFQQGDNTSLAETRRKLVSAKKWCANCDDEVTTKLCSLDPPEQRDIILDRSDDSCSSRVDRQLLKLSEINDSLEDFPVDCERRSSIRDRLADIIKLVLECKVNSFGNLETFFTSCMRKVSSHMLTLKDMANVNTDMTVMSKTYETMSKTADMCHETLRQVIKEVACRVPGLPRQDLVLQIVSDSGEKECHRDQAGDSRDGQSSVVEIINDHIDTQCDISDDVTDTGGPEDTGMRPDCVGSDASKILDALECEGLLQREKIPEIE